MTILVTGAAGFIGFHVASRLLARGDRVIGLDNLNDYYDVGLKRDRLALLQAQAGFGFIQTDIADFEGLKAALAETGPIRGIVHLAAQAGVRYSLTNPHAYLQANLAGHLNMLEIARHCDGLEHMVYASSSSVYGGNKDLPFSVDDRVDHPVSLYAATKKADELMSHCYAHLYRTPQTGLRFFTVYGPWGRPDMSLFLFTKNILEGKPIDVFNYGKHRRDFTYVDDIVEGVIRCIDQVAEPAAQWTGDTPDPGTSNAPYRVYNIGNNAPVELMDFISAIERALGIEAEKNLLPLQPGDVPDTYADVQALVDDLGYKPATSIEDGIANFIAWYKDYYNIS